MQDPSAMEKDHLEQAPSSPDNEDAKLIEVVGEWASTTTIHGLPHVFEFQNYNRLKRAIWAFLLLASFTIMTIILVQVIIAYREYEITVSSHVEYPESMPFPQVTICNANAIDTHYANQTGIWEPVNEDELIQVSQKLDEFIFYTSFKEYEQENTTKVWESEVTPYGRCWTFSEDQLEETDGVIFRPGTYGGLEVFADIEQFTYPEETEAAGLLVFVRQHGVPITQQLSHVLVPPGTVSSVVISRTRFERETDAPWSHCHSSAPEYTQQTCRAQCFNAATVGACGCRNWGDTVHQDLDFCTLADDCYVPSDRDILKGCDEDDDDCPDYLRKMHEDNLCECHKPPCREESYDLTTSNLAISEAIRESLEAELGWGDDYFQNNFVGVRINYDKIREDILSESKAQTFLQLLGTLGGNMGLFAGISFLSMIELFGDLFLMRLIPRLCGFRNLYGLGTKHRGAAGGPRIEL